MQRSSAVEWPGFLVLAMVLILPPPLAPAVIVVSGGCTLPDAVTAANTDAAVGGCSAGAGADAIRLTADVSLASASTGSNALPIVTTEIYIDGEGFTIERAAGSPEFRLFEVGTSGDLRLANVTITNGDSPSNADGGGILNRGTLTLDNAALTGNSAGRSGGGLANRGVALLVNSTLSYNSASDNGGGLYADFGAQTDVVDSALVSNYSFWEGAGLFSYEGGVSITSSTVSGNDPGGMTVFYPFGDNSVLVSNSTISGNTASGLYVYGGYGYPVAAVGNSTLANNDGTNLRWDGSSGADRVVTNSIMAYGGTDCSGFMDGGGNFDSDGSCGGAAAITGLGPLADHGGPTETHALLPGSSAIDAAGACGLLTDQRGLGRAGGACDSGSVERDGSPAIVTTVGGLTSSLARCTNLTAGGTATLADLNQWNCRAAGVTIDSGDRVRQSVRGFPIEPDLIGRTQGIGNGRVRCQNFATGQTVQFQLGGATTFNCRTQGLSFSIGQPVGWTLSGVAN